jgi:hypothetical protein
MLDEPTPTEELRLPRLPGDATLHVPPGEAGFRDALQRLEALEEAIRLHEQATRHPPYRGAREITTFTGSCAKASITPTRTAAADLGSAAPSSLCGRIESRHDAGGSSS